VNADGEVDRNQRVHLHQGGGSIGLGFAIRSTSPSACWTGLTANGRVRTACWRRMTLQAVTPYIAQRLGFNDTKGLVVSRVEEDGPALQAGVRVGDRIRSVNGQEVNSVDDAQRSIYGAQVGDKLRLALDRGGKSLEMTLTLGEAPRRNE
jgi:serine protease Do